MGCECLSNRSKHDSASLHRRPAPRPDHRSLAPDLEDNRIVLYSGKYPRQCEIHQFRAPIKSCYNRRHKLIIWFTNDLPCSRALGPLKRAHQFRWSDGDQCFACDTPVPDDTPRPGLERPRDSPAKGAAALDKRYPTDQVKHIARCARSARNLCSDMRCSCSPGATTSKAAACSRLVAARLEPVCPLLTQELRDPRARTC